MTLFLREPVLIISVINQRGHALWCRDVSALTTWWRQKTLIILYELVDIGYLGAFGIICDHKDIIFDEKRSKRIHSYYSD